MASNYELRSSGGAYDHLLSSFDEEDQSSAASEPPQASAHVHSAQPANSEAPRQIVFADVFKTYPARDGQVTALNHIDLDIHRGEIFGVIGRSGAGKSTLVRTINRLERIDSGRVEVGGVDVQQLSGNALVDLRRRIGMIFQHFNLLRSKTVFDNLALPARAAGLDKAEISRRAERLLRLVGLEGKQHVYPARLSGGQKQRVGIARALMLDPEVLLCDEATSALDPETTQTILSLLRDINRSLGLTIVLITHEMSVIREICDRVAVLEHGSLVESGPVWQVFGRPQHEVTRSLLEPLKVRLPEQLARRLSASADAEHRTLVVQIEIGAVDGGGPGVNLARLSELLGSDASLLHGGVERLQGHVQGRFLIGIDGGSAEGANDRLAAAGISGEVLGYV
ncbi:Methionine import ATP-binding protein MetN [Carnimonas sp. R-84981]|uniref:methionine ABC transporter ATP-binding protein n=1 Tax=Carnimonas bestiolae TaxID=3402172 RepID=UPI003EDBC290